MIKLFENLLATIYGGRVLFMTSCSIYSLDQFASNLIRLLVNLHLSPSHLRKLCDRVSAESHWSLGLAMGDK